MAVLRSYPDLRLGDVLSTIAGACAAGLKRPVPDHCQTIDAGLAAIDARGPGWVDHRYPLEAVLPELKDAGFDAHTIVALFNGNVPLERLGRCLRQLFPDYLSQVADEAVGHKLSTRWRCRLPCCQPHKAGYPAGPGAPPRCRLCHRDRLEAQARPPLLHLGRRHGFQETTGALPKGPAG